MFHWSLVIAITGAGWTRDRLDGWHEWLGYLSLGLVAARLLWGIYSANLFVRFSGFVQSPAVVRGYVSQLHRRGAPRYLGHNPLGGWMILALIGVITALGVSGGLYSTDWLWGYGWLAIFHAGLGWLLCLLILLHISGVMFSGYIHSENLVLSMMNGKKRPSSPDEI